jgi:hypothetical protein
MSRERLKKGVAMLCPKCKTAKSLKIYCYSPSAVYVDREGNTVDESDEFGGFEWDDDSIMECAECEYEGKVRDFLIADGEEPEQKTDDQSDDLREALEEIVKAIQWTCDNMPAWYGVVNHDLLRAWGKARSILARVEEKGVRQ